MSHTPHVVPGRRAHRLVLALGTAGIAGVLVGACSSTSNTAATTTSAAPGSGGSSQTSGSPGTSGSSGSSGSSSSQLRSLSSAVQSGEHLTFKATYTSQTAGGASQTITIEQKPPKSVFASGTTSLINDGTTTYVCTAGGDTQQCVSESTGANPLASLGAILSPQTVLSYLQQAESQAAAHAAGYSLTFSNGTYAGQAAKCVAASGGVVGAGGKYCVTDSGVLAFVQSAGGSFELTDYSAAPPDSDFSLPAGASVITVPSVPTSG